MLNRIPATLWLVLILGGCAFAYYPGLYGEFLLDDFSSLPGLAAISAENPLEQGVFYTLNGIASAIGRPVSLLTFALQWESWPGNPFSFKLVNLLLHLANGILIYLLTRRILAIAAVSTHRLSTISLAITALWLLHPLQISTVLYVVQRMTELSALFTLIGLLFYLHGRSTLSASPARTRYLYMTLGVAIGLTLGILSKENAILLCLFILVLEVTVLRETPRPEHWRPWAFVFLLLPLLALVLYVSPKIIDYAFTPYPTRTFTSLERLVSQSHVLVDYLYNILLPRPNNFGLFHSGYDVPLLSPGTFVKSGLLFALLFIAWRLRRRYPLLSLGILWFFASHALESTALNLELYFEHRNYLGLWGILITLVTAFTLLLDKIQQQHTQRIKKALYLGVGLWSVLIVFVNMNEVRLWANPEFQAAVWAHNNPHSNRAVGHYAYVLTRNNKLHEAVEQYKEGAQVMPQDISMLLNWQELQCISTEIELPSRDALLDRMATGDYTNSVFSLLNEVIGLKQKGKCQTLDNDYIEAMLQKLLHNPHFQTVKAKRNLHVFFINFYYYLKAYEKALAHAQEFSHLYDSADVLLIIAEIQLKTGTKEGYVTAVARLDNYCSSHKIKCLPYKKQVASHIELAVSLVNNL